MTIINTVSEKYFSLNGINFAKIYQPLKQGSENIGIYNVNDTRHQLLQSTRFNEFEIDGVTYSNQAQVIQRLLEVIYAERLSSETTTLLEGKTDKGGYSGTAQDLKDEIDNIDLNGARTYQTLADLNAVDPVPEEGTSAIVANDGTATNNGNYAVSGGAWVKNTDLYENTVNGGNTSKGVTGKAVTEHVNERLLPLFRKSIGTFVQESISVAGGSWQNESSTFSGWGSGIGIVPDFNVIKFRLRHFDNSDIPTQVRVRIREVDQTGTILSEKLVNYTEVFNDELTVFLDNTVSSAGRLWFEYVTDGKVGWFGSSNSNDGTGNASTKYTTAQNLDGTVSSPVTGNPTKPIFVQSFLVASGEGLELTEEGVEYFKENTKGSLLPYFYGQHDFVSSPLSESVCSWQNETSTFSAWGWGVGTRDAFSSVRLRIRGFSVSEPVTQINVRIRENNSSGQILAEKLMSIDDVTNEYLTVDFGTVVDSVSPLYVEYLTDGRIGRFQQGTNLDVGQGATTTNYITSKSLTAQVSTPVTSNQQAPIFVEFFTVDNTLIELTEKGKELLNQELSTSGQFVPRLNLPDNIDVVVGYQTQLFFRGMIEAIDPYKYNIKVTGTVNGNQYPRYYIFTPSVAGTTSFTVTIDDDAGNQIATKTCTVTAHNAASSPASNKKILCVGDSLTAGGIWTGEVLRMLTASGGTPTALNLSNVEFIGTVDKGGGNKYEGYGGKQWYWYTQETTSGDIDAEFVVTSHNKTGVDIASVWQDSNGRSWRLETIVSSTVLSFSRVDHTNAAPASGTLTHVVGATNTSNVVYTSVSGGAVNPFWNAGTDELDFSNYVSSNSFGTIDYVVTLLTWNGMSGGRSTAADHSGLITAAKVFLDKLHTQFPAAKVVLCGIQLPSLNGGLGQNYGDADSGYGNYYELVKTVNGLNLAYQALANESGYSDYVTFVDASVQFDNEYNMPTTTRQVNLRNSQTEVSGSNGVHPSNEGYYQFADAIFRTLNSLL